MSSSSSNLLFLFSTLLIFSSSSSTSALVPRSRTFKYVNQGDLAWPVAEYGLPCRATDVHNHPFHLMFYSTGNTNDGGRTYTYTLGLAMTTRRFQDLGSPFRWVWAANRGNPVHENATLTLGVDGNLVLAESTGVVVWQTGTANKGVVELKLLQNGNLVLVDKNGGFAWQSFDHPTDTLLVGQSLLPGGKLVSRRSADASPRDDFDGPYSMVLEDRKLSFYYNNMIYNEIMLQWDESKVTGKMKKVTFDHLSEGSKQEPRTDLLRLLYYNNTDAAGSIDLAQQKYNSTMSFLRLGSNGDLFIYTLYDIRPYVIGRDFSPWELTYKSDNQCQLPDRCGSFGVCKNDLCIACPTPTGLTKWNKKCEPPKTPPPCSGKNGTGDTRYYKLENVDHFMSRFRSEGPMKMDDCKKKCSGDCGCVGFFYTRGESMCLITAYLGTLIDVNFDEPGSHSAFIKY